MPRIFERAEVEDYVPAISPAMRGLEQAIADLADGAAPVLILGEAGVGKRTLAARLHHGSHRRSSGFEEVRCATLQSDFFSGDGGPYLERGTIYLNEIAELPAVCQEQLVGLCQRMNGHSPGIRLMCSSKRQLDEEIRAGRLNADLYYHISGICLRVPPLRHRREDIPALSEHFFSKYGALLGRPDAKMSGTILRFFLDHAWPGNVRELENAVKTIVALGDERMALAALKACLPQVRSRNGESVSLKEAARAASRQAERELILKVLSRTRWNRKRAAQELHISYKALLYKLKQIGVDDGDSSEREE